MAMSRDDLIDKARSAYGERSWRDAAALFVRADEAGAIASGKLPDSVKQRLVRFHLVDNTRGEPPFWRADELKQVDLSLEGGRLSGKVSVATGDGKRGYRASLLGKIETRGGEISRMDVVVKGEFWGEGRYTRGAPVTSGGTPSPSGAPVYDCGMAVSRQV